MTVDANPNWLDGRAQPSGSSHGSEIGLAHASGFAICHANDALIPATVERVFFEAH